MICYNIYMNKAGCVLITGATGLIGRELSIYLLKRGWQLKVLGRSSENDFRSSFSLPCEYYQWSKPTSSLPPAAALNVDAIINLAGEPIADGRWTKSRKAKLYNSRVSTTRHLVSALLAGPHTVQTFISSSAIGYYGDKADKILSEDTPASSDFLGKLCQDWESETQKLSCRCVQIRTGLVLAPHGGALKKMQPLFELGLGGKLGNGNQWMSWIHIQDLVRIYAEALENSKLRGPINGVAPNPIRNAEFTKELAKALHVSAFLPAPKLGLQLLLGEMSEMLLGGQRVLSQVIQTTTFKFSFPTLREALNEIYSYKSSANDQLVVSKLWVAKERTKVFSFFANEKNLIEVTPKWLGLKKVDKNTAAFQQGSEISCYFQFCKIPFKVITQISALEKDRYFRDSQKCGPLGKWDHEHNFEEVNHGTLITDTFAYRPPLGWLGGRLLPPLLQKLLELFFRSRQKKVASIFAKL